MQTRSRSRTAPIESIAGGVTRSVRRAASDCKLIVKPSALFQTASISFPLGEWLRCKPCGEALAFGEQLG